MIWNELFTFNEESIEISSVKFDPFFDILWVGNKNGKIVSYNILPEAQSFQIYSSFNIKEPVVDILANKFFCVSLGNASLNLNHYGGLELAKIRLPRLQQGNKFTCMDAVRDVRYESSYWYCPSDPANYLITGTDSSQCLLYDLGIISTHVSTPAMTYNVNAPVTCLKSNGHVISVGQQNGSIQLFDGKMRNARPVGGFNPLFPGPVLDMSLMHEDGRVLLALGERRKHNTYPVSQHIYIYIYYLLSHGLQFSPANSLIPQPTLSFSLVFSLLRLLFRWLKL